jgi:hypothetical protein
MSLAGSPGKTKLGGLLGANLSTSLKETPPQPITRGPFDTVMDRLVLVTEPALSVTLSNTVNVPATL